MHKNNKRITYIVVESVIIFLFTTSFFFWYQTFAKTYLYQLGVQVVNLSGYSMMKNSYITITRMTHPVTYDYIYFNRSIMIVITFTIQIAAATLQLVSIPLRLFEKTKYKIWRIINFVSGVLTALAGILIIFFPLFYRAANPTFEKLILGTGTITTAVYLIVLSVIICLNFLQKPVKD